MSDTVHLPSIVDGVLTRFSVSQIKTFDSSKHGGCERRWGFQKIWHVDEPENKGAVESTKCHLFAESYLKTGWSVVGNNNLERAFLAGKWMLPERGDDLLIEMKFDGEISLAGVPCNGRIDVVVPRTDPVLPGLSVEIGDHKFHGDMEERALTSAQLEWDPQMLCYGMVMISKYPGISFVRFTHYNYQKREPRPPEGGRKVSVVLPVEEIIRRWFMLEKLVEKMKLYAGSTSPAQLPANTKACYAYGKTYACPHIETCTKIGGMPVSESGLSEKEAALWGNMVVPPPSTSVPVVIRPVTLPVLIMPDCAACGMALNPDNGSKKQDGTWAHIGCPGKTSPLPVSIAPLLAPDAPKSDPELAAACEPCKDDKNFQHRPAECPKLHTDSTPTETGRRKRRTKAEMEAARAIAAGPGAAPTPTFITVPATTLPPQPLEQLVGPISAVEDPVASAAAAGKRAERDYLATQVLLKLLEGSSPMHDDAKTIAAHAFEITDAFITRSLQ